MIVYDDRGGEKSWHNIYLWVNLEFVEKFGKLNHFIGSLH